MLATSKSNEFALKGRSPDSGCIPGKGNGVGVVDPDSSDTDIDVGVDGSDVGSSGFGAGKFLDMSRTAANETYLEKSLTKLSGWGLEAGGCRAQRLGGGGQN